jgi:hypothetical protein
VSDAVELVEDTDGAQYTAAFVVGETIREVVQVVPLDS